MWPFQRHNVSKYEKISQDIELNRAIMLRYHFIGNWETKTF